MDNTCEITIDNYHLSGGKYAVGWYFIDETGRIDQNGPYKTKEEAEQYLDLYVKSFLV